MDHLFEEDDTFVVGLCLVSCGVALIEANKKEQKSMKRRWWERPHLGIAKRSVYGFSTLLSEMRENDIESYRKYLRFDPSSFDKLLDYVKGTITHSGHRMPIDAKTRLKVTLRFLASGDSYESLAVLFRLGISTTRAIVIETLDSIINCVGPQVIPDPTEMALANVAEGYWNRWDFPNCCGSVDGKHIRIKAPSHCGSEYYNYKGYFSIVLMAVCDYRYRFIAVDVGAQGRQHDSGVLNYSTIGKSLEKKKFNLPQSSPIPYGDNLPHFLFGDEAFGVRDYLLSPYSRISSITFSSTTDQKLF